MSRWVPPAWVVKPAMRFRNRLFRMHASMVPPPLQVMERMNGLVEARVLSIVADLGIPDLLAAGPKTATELAEGVGADPDALDRALALLVSRGLLGRSRGRYANNAFSSVLRSDDPESMRDWARFFGSEWHTEILKHARHSIMTGEAAPDQAFGVPYFEYLNSTNPAAGETFNAALAGTSKIAGPIVAKGYDFSGIKRLCDVGGGSGGMLAEILTTYPTVRGVLFDLPTVAEQARANLAARGLLDRCEIESGSFFEEVPGGCDAYMMQAIVHDWDDDSCEKILGTIKRAMTPGGRLLVIENVLQAEPVPADQFARSFDVLMLVITGAGRERTLPQFEALFERAGLRLRRDVLLPSMFHVLELEAV